MVFAMFMWGVRVGLLWVVPLFASWSMILLPEILAQTFCTIMLCWIHRILCTMAKISSSLRWLCWDEGWRM